MIIKETTLLEINAMYKDYHNYLIAPMDDMYEDAIIPACHFYIIEKNSKVIGYFTLNNEKNIMQFYIEKDFICNKKDIFNFVIENKKIKQALCCSYDPILYELCKEISKTSVVSDYLYCESDYKELSPSISNIKYCVASSSDFDIALEYYNEILITGDWLKPYLQQRIQLSELVFF